MSSTEQAPATLPKSSSCAKPSPTTATAARTETIVVWADEWVYAKQGVRQIRRTLGGAAAAASAALDLPAYLTLARSYGRSADDYILQRTRSLGRDLQRHYYWVVPGAAAAAAGAAVAARSFSRNAGLLVSARNGIAVAALLVAFLFPREIVAAADAALPFQAPPRAEEGAEKEKAIK